MCRCFRGLSASHSNIDLAGVAENVVDSRPFKSPCDAGFQENQSQVLLLTVAVNGRTSHPHSDPMARECWSAQQVVAKLVSRAVSEITGHLPDAYASRDYRSRNFRKRFLIRMLESCGSSFWTSCQFLSYLAVSPKHRILRHIRLTQEHAGVLLLPIQQQRSDTKTPSRLLELRSPIQRRTSPQHSTKFFLGTHRG